MGVQGVVGRAAAGNIDHLNSMKRVLRPLFLLAGMSWCLLTPFSVLAYASPGRPDGYVTDFANILSAEKEQQLEGVLEAQEERSGNEVAVATIPALQDETIETYATKLFEEWGIGKKGKDNGVLILLAPNDRKVRIEVGYGLEPTLTDAMSQQIVNEALPLFRTNDMEGAVSSLVNDVDFALDSPVFREQLQLGYDEAMIESNRSDEPASVFEWGVVGIIMLVVVFGVGLMVLGWIGFFVSIILHLIDPTKAKYPRAHHWASSMSRFASGSSGGRSSSSSGSSFGGGRSGGGGASGSW